ncbi:MAG: glycosyltransferase family 2 protein [Planctomycetes bacterium]|nr:glycosyltransferase family 2 protein [Planctomycetota bacterium]
MKTSIIVATYNAPEYLRKVLAGFLVQTVRPHELVIADDGSGPETAGVVKEYSEKVDFPVMHTWQEDRGFRVAAARNNATRKATGDYLIYVDGDCIPGPRFVEDHMRVAARDRFIQGKRIMVTQAGKDDVDGSESLGELIRLLLSRKIKKAHHLLRIPGLAVKKRGMRGIRSCNFALHRDNLEKVNGWNEEFEGWGREDSELAVRLVRVGVERRDLLFSGIVFHLPHEEHDQDGLANNNRLLKEAWEGPTFVKRGLERNETGPDGAQT